MDLFSSHQRIIFQLLPVSLRYASCDDNNLVRVFFLKFFQLGEKRILAGSFYCAGVENDYVSIFDSINRSELYSFSNPTICSESA